MATVTPTYSTDASGYTTITWTPIATGDTIVASRKLGQSYRYHASITITGTFGGGTVTMSGSNNDSAYATVKDLNSTAVSTATAAVFEVTSGLPYLKPTVSGGAADATTVIAVIRRT